MRKIELTERAFQALCYLVYENPCRSRCCIEENQYNKIDCEQCNFTIGKYELQRVLEGMD